ncbi:MAG: tRNA (adenosine(37)-N6)-threonylcarbamoyltransferase complex dimerization subunit type 1 TsaB [Melioribacteraceae bacterium]|nr:tRNA (adenosine(37)-N6)-threonylcarbamoyltransferase complex dimerization subunit type 1 TsaB [Melioribacteraceae bacterium]
MTNKKILAIETSGELCSVAISFGINKYDERTILMKHIHSEKLIPMIDELFRANKTNAAELDCLSVSIGPGSFTGLRIGMTAAKGIAFAANLPIVPVPTFEALSLEVLSYLQNETTFCIINKANVEECYFAKYIVKNGKSSALINSELINKNEINSKKSDCNIVFGNMSSKTGLEMISSPRASSVAKWTYLYGEDLLTFDYDYLEPNYLKNFKVLKKK